MPIQLNYKASYEVLGPISISLISHQYHPPSIPKLFMNEIWGSYAPFQHSLLFRGIGFKAALVENLWAKHVSDCAGTELNNNIWSSISKYEFPFLRYLTVRVGHSFYFYLPIQNSIGVRILKKDRKLVIYSSSIGQLSMFSRYITSLRFPSVYTGRGIRSKGTFPRRKLGKKDVRKGRFF